MLRDKIELRDLQYPGEETYMIRLGINPPIFQM
jgi:hypothetical protein